MLVIDTPLKLNLNQAGLCQQIAPTSYEQAGSVRLYYSTLPAAASVPRLDRWRASRSSRSRAKRWTPAKIDAASRCASAITSGSRPPVSHWLSQSEVSEYASVKGPTSRMGHIRRVPV